MDATTYALLLKKLQTKANLVDGKIPAEELPSYVDDIIEGYYYNNAFYSDSQHTELITGEQGKIYLDVVTNDTYRWSGNSYICVSEFTPVFEGTYSTPIYDVLTLPNFDSHLLSVSLPLSFYEYDFSKGKYPIIKLNLRMYSANTQMVVTLNMNDFVEISPDVGSGSQYNWNKHLTYAKKCYYSDGRGVGSLTFSSFPKNCFILYADWFTTSSDACNITFRVDWDEYNMATLVLSCNNSDTVPISHGAQIQNIYDKIVLYNFDVSKLIGINTSIQSKYQTLVFERKNFSVGGSYFLGFPYFSTYESIDTHPIDGGGGYNQTWYGNNVVHQGTTFTLTNASDGEGSFYWYVTKSTRNILNSIDIQENLAKPVVNTITCENLQDISTYGPAIFDLWIHGSITRIVYLTANTSDPSLADLYDCQLSIIGVDTSAATFSSLVLRYYDPVANEQKNVDLTNINGYLVFGYTHVGDYTD